LAVIETGTAQLQSLAKMVLGSSAGPALANDR
jgi:hypothetical protein